MKTATTTSTTTTTTTTTKKKIPKTKMKPGDPGSEAAKRVGGAPRDVKIQKRLLDCEF